MDEQREEKQTNYKEYWNKTKQYANTATVFAKKHTVLLTLLVVLLLQFMPNQGGAYPWGGIWLRAQADNLQIANNIAASSVDNFVRQQASIIVSQQYPNLPDENRQKLINDVTKKILNDQKSDLDAQRSRLAQEVRDHYQYEEGGRKFTYMPDIDPYFYLRYARNIVEKGHVYDTLKDGRNWDDHMSAPFGTTVENSWHPYVMVFVYWGYKLFDSTIPLMEAAAYHPLVIIFLSLIFLFLLTRRIAGNLAAFVSVTLLSLLPSVLGRTNWGHPDTDSYNIFFPVLTFFLMVEALYAESFKKRVLLSVLAGISAALYVKFWSGWWYVFDFILGALLIALVFELILTARNGWSAVKNDQHIRKFATMIVILLVVSAVFSAFFGSFGSFKHGLLQGAISFTNIKDASLTTLWPNVFTTVAELNASSLSGVVDSAGGLLIFFFGLLGVMLLLFKSRHESKFEAPYDFIWPVLLVLIFIGVRNSWLTFIILVGLVVGLLLLHKKFRQRDHNIVLGVLLALWFAGTAYAGIKGVRFGMLIGPAVSVAFGVAAGELYKMLAPFAENLKIKKAVTGLIVLALFMFFIIGPSNNHLIRNAYAISAQDIPIVNDAWYNVLTKIKQESKPDAIINSWWDFGHHFKYFSDRRVTFDGASQNAPQAHWVGKVLQTSSEDEAIAILRMLDCGGNSAYDVFYNKTKDPITSISSVREIIMLDKEEAAQYSSERGVPEVVQYTHCDPPENYFIASEDMVSKSQVWSHFGLWDFKRAEVWLKWRLVDSETAIPEMMSRFNWSKETAAQVYQEAVDIANSDNAENLANQWISPWLSYINSPQTCARSNNLINCGSISINLTAKTAQAPVPGGMAFAGELAMYNKKGDVSRTKLSGGNEQLVVVIWPQGSDTLGMAQFKDLSESMFTRLFFMNGIGLEHFKPFAEDRQLFSGKVSVWKVDWNGGEKYIPSDTLPKTNITSGTLVHLNYIGWLDNETVFDSNILDWREKNISKDTSFAEVKTIPLEFKYGEPGLIPGFTKQIEGMKPGEERIIVVPPEEAYGTDPSKHPLGNQTLHFKIRVESVE